MDHRSVLTRYFATPLLFASLLAPSALGCQSHTDPPPPVDDTRSVPVAARPATPSTGVSTTTKVAVLAGAAALYYLYKRHQNATASAGADSQYYLSKNGRVYYRDADHRAHWVTPPPEGIQVPESEAGQYSGFQGYNNSTSGRDLSGLANDAEAPQ